MNEEQRRKAFYESDEWKFGHWVQKQAYKVLCRANGWRWVAPYFNAKDDQAAGGPRIATNGREVVAPDIFAHSVRYGDTFFEVKGKSRPGFLRIPRKHTHGMDAALFNEYAKQHRAGIKIVVLVYEKLSPVMPDVNDDAWVRAHMWWAVPFDHLYKHSHHAKHWPRRNGAGSKGGLGGRCWARYCMRSVAQMDASNLEWHGARDDIDRRAETAQQGSLF